MAQAYSVSIDTVHEMFIECSCSKVRLLEILKEGKQYIKWGPLEDIALEKDEESAEFKYVLKLKGPEEIERRKKFLGL